MIQMQRSGFFIAALCFAQLGFAENLLFIGDSLSVSEGIGLGHQLDSKFRNLGLKTRTLAACGSSPSWFVSGGKVSCGYLRVEPDGKKTYLDYHRNRALGPYPLPRLREITNFDSRPQDLAVIQQGTNLYSYVLSGAEKSLKTQVKRLLSELYQKNPKSKCLWVLPPEIRKYDGKEVTLAQKNRMDDWIEEAIEDFSDSIGRKENFCETLKSRDYTKPPRGGDGTHFSSANPDWVEATYAKVRAMLNKDTSSKKLVDEIREVREPKKVPPRPVKSHEHLPNWDLPPPIISN